MMNNPRYNVAYKQSNVPLMVKMRESCPMIKKILSIERPGK
jgi:hypothetical protein